MFKKIYKKFDAFMEKHGRKRVILDRQSKGPYLTRYYLFLKDRKRFPFNIFLHNFHRSDPDDLHDHPFGYATLILKGGYWEWVPTYKLEFDGISEDNTSGNFNKIIVGETKVWRGPGHFRTCKADSYHRIELEPNVNCWTLFMPGPQKRNWGFLTHKDWKADTFNWVNHEDYIAKKTGKI